MVFRREIKQHIKIRLLKRNVICCVCLIDWLDEKKKCKSEFEFLASWVVDENLQGSKDQSLQSAQLPCPMQWAFNLHGLPHFGGAHTSPKVVGISEVRHRDDDKRKMTSQRSEVAKFLNERSSAKAPKLKMPSWRKMPSQTSQANSCCLCIALLHKLFGCQAHSFPEPSIKQFLH